jgi:hypothetical protein
LRRAVLEVGADPRDDVAGGGGRAGGAEYVRIGVRCRRQEIGA